MNIKLIFRVESTLKEELVFENDFIRIIATECDKDQYNIYNHDNIIVCENPKCFDSCPVDSNAKCIITDGNVYGKNIIDRNTCKCNNGWKGDLCETKDYIDFG
ncbi:hypothetical protein PIROE2DRAFT_6389 [Piromyces sp. E2]|nr:hypothetical protein PIROE2DRAFT_6389 [Piromyces sp. E2]|eukprot:OUM66438.1 hypothetical protein PIROE2DRAFT_6389 [Piromyces sp. E2]